MRFRPCIDLREGKVVQIVGGSLQDGSREGPITHFRTERSPAYFARLYKSYALTGGHVISLGPGNREAALSALQAFPGGLQYGGGVTVEKAELPDLPATKALVLQDSKRPLSTQPYPHWLEKTADTGTIIIDQKVMRITVEKE